MLNTVQEALDAANERIKDFIEANNNLDQILKASNEENERLRTEKAEVLEDIEKLVSLPISGANPPTPYYLGAA